MDPKPQNIGRIEQAITEFRTPTWSATFESILETLSTSELILLNERLYPDRAAA